MYTFILMFRINGIRYVWKKTHTYSFIINTERYSNSVFIYTIKVVLYKIGTRGMPTSENHLPSDAEKSTVKPSFLEQEQQSQLFSWHLCSQPFFSPSVVCFCISMSIISCYLVVKVSIWRDVNEVGRGPCRNQNPGPVYYVTLICILQNNIELYIQV